MVSKMASKMDYKMAYKMSSIHTTIVLESDLVVEEEHPKLIPAVPRTSSGGTEMKELDI